jgi:hypothetical protein
MCFLFVAWNKTLDGLPAAAMSSLTNTLDFFFSECDCDCECEWDCACDDGAADTDAERERDTGVAAPDTERLDPRGAAAVEEAAAGRGVCAPEREPATARRDDEDEAGATVAAARADAGAGAGDAHCGRGWPGVVAPGSRSPSPCPSACPSASASASAWGRASALRSVCGSHAPGRAIRDSGTSSAACTSPAAPLESKRGSTRTYVPLEAAAAAELPFGRRVGVAAPLRLRLLVPLRA